MSARFRRGLVVGKLAPLHRGHELVIGRALERCDEVVVLSYSKPELAGCEPAARARWLAALFPAARSLALSDELLAPHGLTLPANDAPDDEQRQLVAQVLARVLGVTVDAVFTSEDYGEGLAGALARTQGTPVTHVMVDRERREVPISGSLVRADPFAHRQWLAPVVLASFVRRVCLLGGESSGKTTLAETLAGSFRTAWVAEYGRTLWEARRGALAYADMLDIAERQIASEERMAAASAGRWLFCDTSPLTTAFYSHDLFGQVDPRLAALAARPYHATFLCAPDFPFVQDGTRRDPAFRARQHLWYRRQLDAAGVPYTVVSGPVPARLARVRAVLEGGA
jgi:HTH-type transcriptional repressor of NAD biosynthesis genes